jgi:hypothetical protein
MFHGISPVHASYADGKITIIGKGTTPISYTSLADIAGVFMLQVIASVRR